MKKLLVLVLVLSMASMANAVILTLSSSGTAGSETLSVVASSSGADPAAYFGISISGGSLSAIVKGTAASSQTAYFCTAAEMGLGQPNGEVWIYGWISPETGFTDGTWATTTATHTAAVTATLYLYNTDGDTVVSTQGVNLVPEPMTMALLGLGGLFLRRRK